MMRVRRDQRAAARRRRAFARPASSRRSAIGSRRFRKRRNAPRRVRRTLEEAVSDAARRKRAKARADARDRRREAAGDTGAAARRIVSPGLRTARAGAPGARRDAIARHRRRRPEARADQRQVARDVGRGAARRAADRPVAARAILAERGDAAGLEGARRICGEVSRTQRRRRAVLAADRRQVPARRLAQLRDAISAPTLPPSMQPRALDQFFAQTRADDRDKYVERHGQRLLSWRTPEGLFAEACRVPVLPYAAARVPATLAGPTNLARRC